MGPGWKETEYSKSDEGSSGASTEVVVTVVCFQRSDRCLLAVRSLTFFVCVRATGLQRFPTTEEVSSVPKDLRGDCVEEALHGSIS